MLLSNREREIWSVTDLTSYVYLMLDSEEKLKSLWVEGEISNFSQHSGSKHMYFTLKDENTKIRAAMFASNNRRLRFTPKNGDRVLVRGSLSLYEREGQIQFYVSDVRLSGVGDLFVAYERLKQKLMEEGLFSAPKKELPLFPKRVGVITSSTGAAIRDIMITMKRRYPPTSILIYPVSVQGAKAPREIAKAIDEMNELNEVDVLIVGRGGGSIEELWAFNEEIVARSIFRSEIPVVSAVGHETDHTISDFVADHRAATPTAAAEMVVPHIHDLQERLSQLERRLSRAQASCIKQAKERLNRMVDRPVFRYPDARLLQYIQRVDQLDSRLNQAIVQRIKQESSKWETFTHRLKLKHPKERLRRLQDRLQQLQREQKRLIMQQLKGYKQSHHHLISHLDALSPLRVMQRGYAIAFRHDGQEVIRSHRQVSPGDLIKVRLGEGQLKCQVWRSEESSDE